MLYRKKERQLIAETTSFLCRFKSLYVSNVTAANKLIKSVSNAAQLNLVLETSASTESSPLQARTSIMESLVLMRTIISLEGDNSSHKPIFEPKMKRTFRISETPIVSEIWNLDRVWDHLEDIGVDAGNPYDGFTNRNNIWGKIIRPLDLVIIENGNHSTNSAILKNEGEVSIEGQYDISPLFDVIRFNGIDYLYKKPKSIMPKWKKVNRPVNYYFGLLFEISKIISKSHSSDVLTGTE